MAAPQGTPSPRAYGVILEERQHAIVQNLGCGDRRLAIVELGEGDLAVGVDEGLLVDATHTPSRCPRRRCPGRRNSPDARSRTRHANIEVGLILPDPPQQRGELARHCHACPFGAPPLQHLEAPALERRRPPDRGQQYVRRLLEIMPRHRVPLPRDTEHHIGLARLVALGR